MTAPREEIKGFGDPFNETTSSFRAIGLFPADRSTIFGNAGSHAFYRSRKYTSKLRKPMTAPAGDGTRNRS